MMANHLLLTQAVCQAFPQGCPSLLPALAYLYETAPQGVAGLSARDLPCGWAIATPRGRGLAPFLVPHGLPGTDVAARLFTSFRELYGVFARATREQPFRNELRENQRRYDRDFEQGETVFRKVPR